MEEKGLTSLEALGIAILSEMDAQELYRTPAERTTSELVKQRFENLVKEEKQHQILLEEAYRKLLPDAELKLPPSILPADVKGGEGLRPKSMKDVISFALDEERRSREFYPEAALKTDEPSGKRLLNFLADMEHVHAMRLQAEYETLLLYPNYFETGEEPWRPEQRMRKE